MNEQIAKQLSGKRVAFVLTGSYCQLAAALEAMSALVVAGAKVLPVISYSVNDFDSRFGTAEEWRQLIKAKSGAEDIIDSLNKAEPIGPGGLTDALVIAPCSGNTIAKLALGITDTPALMAAKSHLRGGKPLVIAVSTNDGLAANAKNIGLLLNSKNIYFVPFGQDEPSKKPTSLLARMDLLPQAVAAALDNYQLQPLLQ
jgi:dipicolinate synthase subunit B